MVDSVSSARLVWGEPDGEELVEVIAVGDVIAETRADRFWRDVLGDDRAIATGLLVRQEVTKSLRDFP